MEIDENKALAFAKTLVHQGIDIYGRDRLAEICFIGDFGLLDDNSIEPLSDNLIENVNNLFIEYSKINVSAKMTAIHLAKQYNIPIPSEVSKKKKRSRILGFINRK